MNTVGGAEMASVMESAARDAIREEHCLERWCQLFELGTQLQERIDAARAHGVLGTAQDSEHNVGALRRALALIEEAAEAVVPPLAVADTPTPEEDATQGLLHVLIDDGAIQVADIETKIERDVCGILVKSGFVRTGCEHEWYGGIDGPVYRATPLFMETDPDEVARFVSQKLRQFAPSPSQR